MITKMVMTKISQRTSPFIEMIDMDEKCGTSKKTQHHHHHQHSRHHHHHEHGPWNPAPVIEVINMDEEGGIGKETQHRCRDETACDVGSRLSHKVDNHLQHCYHHNNIII